MKKMKDWAWAKQLIEDMIDNKWPDIIAECKNLEAKEHKVNEYKEKLTDLVEKLTNKYNTGILDKMETNGDDDGILKEVSTSCRFLTKRLNNTNMFSCYIYDESKQFATQMKRDIRSLASFKYAKGADGKLKYINSFCVSLEKAYNWRESEGDKSIPEILVIYVGDTGYKTNK